MVAIAFDERGVIGGIARLIIEVGGAMCRKTLHLELRMIGGALDIEQARRLRDEPESLLNQPAISQFI